MQEIAFLHKELEDIAHIYHIDDENVAQIKKVCADIPFLNPFSIIFLQKIDGRWYVN